MGKYNFFEFKGNDTISTHSNGAGYLSFLPLAFQGEVDGELVYRHYELEHIVLLEVCGKGQQDWHHRLDLLTQDIGFWLFNQFRGKSKVYLPHGVELSENRCLPFASLRSTVAVALSAGKVWLSCIGFKRNGLPLLTEEYKSLKRLVDFEQQRKAYDLLLTDVGIGHKQRALWEQIRNIVYKPFHTRLEIGLLVEKLLQEIMHVGSYDMQAERSRLGIYHEALAYIRTHCDGHITTETVAQALHVSPRTLNRAFEDKPIKLADYIHRLKLLKAQELLYRGDMSVEEVANALNFSSRNYFSKEFKKYFFEVPSSIRKM